MGTKWRYYQHALLPECEPHEEPVFDSGRFDVSFSRRPEGVPLFARWTSDFDCGYETAFWYTILDTPFVLEQAKRKHRYEIRKGLGSFDFRQISYNEWSDAIREILNRVNVEEYGLLPISEDLRHDEAIEYFGVFPKGTDELVGWASVIKQKQSLELCSVKALYRYRKDSVNAALIYGVLAHYESLLDAGWYVSNGTRPISHPTNFNEYLERMFGFRKAYCVLHVKYRKVMRLALVGAKCFRGFLRPDKCRGGLLGQMRGVLLLDEYARACKNEKKNMQSYR